MEYIIGILIAAVIVFNVAIYAAVRLIKPFLDKRQRRKRAIAVVLLLMAEVLFVVWAMRNGFVCTEVSAAGCLLLLFSGLLMSAGMIVVLNRQFFEVVFNHFYTMTVTRVDDRGVWGQICIKKHLYHVVLRDRSGSSHRDWRPKEVVNVRVVNLLDDDDKFEVVPI